MNETPKTSEAAGTPSNNWEATAERLFECSQKLERNEIRLKHALTDEGHAHEIWALAQRLPDEGALDAIDRIHAFLSTLACSARGESITPLTDAIQAGCINREKHHEIFCAWSHARALERKILHLRAELVIWKNNYNCAVEHEAAFLDVLREVKRWQADGRNGHCLPVIGGRLLERLESLSSPNDPHQPLGK